MAQIHWKAQVSADFNTAADWSTGSVPGASDDAILDAAGATAYTVSTSTAETVNSIQLASTATLNIGARTFTATNGTGAGANAGTIAVLNNEFFAVGGGVDNIGAITLNSVGNTTEFTFNANTTLTGAGHVTLSDNANNFMFGATAATSLTNFDNTISGAGQLGDAQMTFVIQAKGVVNATGGNALILDTAGQTVSNSGLLEGSGTAGLTILNTAVNGSSGGVIQANTASTVNLQSADIQGGTLTSVGTGAVQVVDRGTLLDGTSATVTNTGVFNVTNNNWLSIQGVIANGKAGTINMKSVGNDTHIFVTAANATITGGAVILSDNANNTIQGTISGAAGSQVASTLTNKTTISGAGLIGNVSLTLVNAKTIDATGGNALIIDVGGGNFASSSTVTNTGLLEATNPNALATTGGLDLRSETIAGGAAGVIEANGTATHVDLQGATIAGGTLVTANGGVIETFGSDRGSLLDGTTSVVNNTGVLNVTNNAWLYLQGTINNTGSINVQSSGNDTRLRMNGNTVLTGSGPITLSDNFNNTIEATAAATTLTNVSSTISGAGALGNGSLTFINDAAGVVDATGTGNALRINTSGQTLTNLGLIEATGAAGMVITSTLVDDTGGGTISAGTGSAVNLQGATIAGGTLATSGSGVIETFTSDRGSVLDGITNAVNNTGVLNVTNNAWLYLEGTINNTGAINVLSSGNDTRLRMNGNTVLTGGGPITLSDNANNTIEATAAATTLTNVSSTISGAGALGNGSLTFINDAAGVVDATGTGNALRINTSGQTLTNLGLIEATGAAGMLITSTLVDDTGGGTISAGNGSAVALQGSTIAGGTLATSGTGVVETAGSDRGSLLDGTSKAVNNSGVLNVTNNAWLYLQGTIHNTGAINVQSSANDTRLRLNASVTLTGGGPITLSDNSNNMIDAAVAATLTNVSSTISGAGLIGNGALVLVNDKAGVIDGTGGNTLILATSNTVTNSGLIEATGAGGLLIRSSTVDGATGGTIAAGNASTLTLQSSTIIGGTLSSTGTGVVQINDRNSLLDGTTATLTNAATFNVTNNNWLYIQGTINNTGSINLNSVGSDTRLRLNANTTLNGNGVIFLNGNSNNTFEGVSAGLTLTNNGNTLEGSGNLFSGNNLILINNKGGVVDANGTAALVLSTPGHTITNAGTLEGTGAGGLVISGATVAGAGGTILAAAGSKVTLQTTTLTGGAMSVAATGEIVIGNGSTATIAAVTSAAGTILVDSTASVTSLIFNKSVSLSGGGVLELSANKNNIVRGTSTAIVLTNVDDLIEGSGKLGDKKMVLVNDAGATIDANSKVALTINTGVNTITNAGLIEATNKGKGVISSAVNNTGTLEVVTGNLTINGAVSGTGSAVIDGGTMNFASSFTQNVAFTGTTGKLELAQSQSYTGQVSGFSHKGKTSLDLRDITFTGPTQATFSGTTASGVLTVTDGTHTANITLVGNYRTATFVTSSDGNGGVLVVDPPSTPHAFISAMASLGAASATPVHAASATASIPHPLARPGV